MPFETLKRWLLERAIKSADNRQRKHEKIAHARQTSMAALKEYLVKTHNLHPNGIKVLEASSSSPTSKELLGHRKPAAQKEILEMIARIRKLREEKSEAEGHARKMMETKGKLQKRRGK